CGLGPSTLALLTSRSTCSPAAATSALRCVGSATSPAIATTPWSSATARSSSSAPRASTTRRQPRCASTRVNARPRPRDAPVTIPMGMEPPYEPAGPSRQRPMVLGPRVDQPRPNGGDGRLCPVGDAELRQHVTDVGLDRLLGDGELACDSL